jgi:hypothetical protein
VPLLPRRPKIGLAALLEQPAHGAVKVLHAEPQKLRDEVVRGRVRFVRGVDVWYLHAPGAAIEERGDDLGSALRLQDLPSEALGRFSADFSITFLGLTPESS